MDAHLTARQHHIHLASRLFYVRSRCVLYEQRVPQRLAPPQFTYGFYIRFGICRWTPHTCTAVRDIWPSIRSDRCQRLFLCLADWMCLISEPVSSDCVSILGGHWRLWMFDNRRRCNCGFVPSRSKRSCNSSLQSGSSIRSCRRACVRWFHRSTNWMEVGILDTAYIWNFCLSWD